MYISNKYVESLLEYDEVSGDFFWKVGRKGSKGRGQKAGTLTKKGYIDVCIDGRKYGLHRLAFLIKTGTVPDNVDHKNGIKSDNSWLNLRPATTRENSFNYKGWGAKSQYKNVYYDPRGIKKWFVRITKQDGSKESLGYFNTPEEANDVAKLGRARNHGEFLHEL